ncbi:MAG: hypothetical protein KatS3mg084_0469 [Candidatus Dojkabacteria bacterium]|nr:MAG: hypothetical protein KatS3mg084_0469 [Candidatus Dojkabacteria bacterium]
MKVGLYQSKGDASSLEEFEVYNALNRRHDVEEVIFLSPGKFKLMIESSRLYLNYGEFNIEPGIFDVLIIRGDFASVTNAIVLADYCRSIGIKVFDNNLTRIKYLINKKADYVKLINAGIRVPNTYFFSSLDRFKEANLKFPLVMKPPHTGQGYNVMKVESYDDVERILLELDKSIQKFMFQEMIEYEHDLRVLTAGDEVVGCMKRIPPEGDFRANFSIGGSVEPFQVNDRIKELAIKAMKACDLLVAGVDILIDKKGEMWLLETNHTPGIEGITQALGRQVADRFTEFMIRHAC